MQFGWCAWGQLYGSWLWLVLVGCSVLVTGALFSVWGILEGQICTGDWALLCLSFMPSPPQKLKIARQFPKKVKTLDFHALHLKICLWNCNLIGMHVSELNILRAQFSTVLFVFVFEEKDSFGLVVLGNIKWEVFCLLFPFNSIQDPAHEMGLPMCRLGLPTSGSLDICLKQANA